MSAKKGQKRKIDENDDADEAKRGRHVVSTDVCGKYDLQWHSFDDRQTTTKHKAPALYYLYSQQLPGLDKIAAFDIDYTVITTKSGKKFPVNSKDWQFFDKCVPNKLKQLNDTGHRLLFISNQAGIEKGTTKFVDIKDKISDILAQLDIPVYVLISTGESHYRKPSNQMFLFFVNKLNNNVPLDMNNSFFVGDAAGRLNNWAPGRKKDFSATDRMFAHNCNLKFYTPEEYFLEYKQTTSFEWGSIDPNQLLTKFKTTADEQSTNKQYYSANKEIVLLIGPPASGKTTFFKNHLQEHNYVHVNRDSLQTMAKCIKAAEDALAHGKSVCIDNTNPSKQVRVEFISLAKKHAVQIRCICLDTDIKLCHHLNYVRQNQTKSQIRRVPDVGYNMFKSQYQEPTLAEGFCEILKIPFHPKFESVEHENLFKQWTA